MKNLQISTPFYPVIREHGPFLLKKVQQGDLILQIFLNGIGKLFGAVTSNDLSYKVPLKDLPILLDPSYLKTPLETAGLNGMELFLKLAFGYWEEGLTNQESVCLEYKPQARFLLQSNNLLYQWPSAVM